MPEPQIKQEEAAVQTLEEVSSDGDVILAVGPDKKKMRVKSNYLRTASRVFDSMSGPNWAEGQNLSSSAPKEVPLEVDDFDALLVICSLIHHRVGSVPDDLTPLEVFRVAVTANKYDCVHILKYVSNTWLKGCNGKDFMDLGRVMVAAYLLNNAAAFKESSAQFVMHTTESFGKLLTVDELSDHMTCTMVLKLEEHRSQLRLTLRDLIDCWAIQDCMGRVGHSPSCPKDNWKRQMTYGIIEYFRKLQQVKLFSMGNLRTQVSLAQVLQSVRNVKRPDPPCNCTQNSHSGEYHRLMNEIQRQLGTWEKGAGLSLNSFQTPT